MNYPIPTEYCLIVNAFNQATTLRGAAILLNTDPAGLVRKVQKISSEYGFLQKTGNRWTVTESGRRVAQWTDEMLISQKKLLDEKPRLRIAAFTWLAEEMLIKNFRKLEVAFNSKYSWSYKMVASNLEQEILQSRSDFVITGHAPNDPTIGHKKITVLPWVVIIPHPWKKDVSGKSKDQLIAFLQSKPFIRHATMNPEQVLGFQTDTTSNLIVDGVIGLRSAVINELGWSAVPAMSVQGALREKKVIKLNIQTHIKDEVSIWWLRARKDSASNVGAIVKWISDFSVS